MTLRRSWSRTVILACCSITLLMVVIPSVNADSFTFVEDGMGHVTVSTTSTRLSFSGSSLEIFAPVGETFVDTFATAGSPGFRPGSEFSYLLEPDGTTVSDFLNFSGAQGVHEVFINYLVSNDSTQCSQVITLDCNPLTSMVEAPGGGPGVPFATIDWFGPGTGGTTDLIRIVSTEPVPEPSAVFLLGTVLVGIVPLKMALARGLPGARHPGASKPGAIQTPRPTM
jgi:hypothetical protein